MTDGPTRRETDAIRDDSGKTYEIHGDHATDTPREPRDSFGGETPIVMGGGAAGIGAIGINTNLDEGGGAGTDAGVRSTSDSGLHGSVAEAADLGQRPLRDYKRDADLALDATDTAISATRSDTGPVASYTSDGGTTGATGTTGSASDVSSVTGSRVTGDIDRRADRVVSTTGTGSSTINASNDNTGAADTAGESVATMGTAMGSRDLDSSDVGVGAMSGISMDDGRDDRNVGGGGAGERITGAAAGIGGATVSPERSAPTAGGASMSGSAIGNANAGETLTTVREGFRVVDASGDEIGKVRDLRSGDASAATVDAPMDSGESGGATRLLAAPGGVGTGGTGTAGSAGGAGGAAAIFALGQTGDGGEPNVDEPAWSRLSRVGFIKIDAKGWFASDRYAAADEVARVEGETVYLSVTKDQLISER